MTRYNKQLAEWDPESVINAVALRGHFLAMETKDGPRLSKTYQS